MTEIEQEEEIIETIEEVVEDNEEPTVEEQEEEEITVDDYFKEKQRREKAEKALVELKKANKQTPKSSDDVRAILAEEKFYDKNSEAEAYRKEIESYVKKWLSRDEAYLIVSHKDNEIQKTRDVYWKSLIWKWDNSWIAIISIDDFDKMTPKSQEEYTNKMTSKYGKIKFK